MLNGVLVGWVSLEGLDARLVEAVNWPNVLEGLALSTAFIAVGLFGALKFQKGWGHAAEDAPARYAHFRFITALGYTVLPVTVASALFFLAFLSGALSIAFELRIFVVLMLAFGTMVMPVAVWAVKEYIAPSRWRRTPAWLAEANGVLPPELRLGPEWEGRRNRGRREGAHE